MLNQAEVSQTNEKSTSLEKDVTDASGHLKVQPTPATAEYGAWFHDISDALCEKERVQFAVRSYRGPTAESALHRPLITVLRYHEDFVWLHETLVDNEDYAGVIIPPVPIKPNFADLRAKLNKLVELEGSIDRERYTTMKKEVEGEYLSKFKKAVSNHEKFLRRLADSSKFNTDENFLIFISYEGALDVRGKNAREMFTDFFKSLAKSADEVLRPSQKETNDYFQRYRAFLEEYNQRISDASRFGEELTKNMEEVSNSYMQSYAALDGLRALEKREFAQFLQKMSSIFDEVRKTENKSIDDTDLKLCEALRYTCKESAAALDLLYRRSKALTNFEAANKAVDRARLKRRDIALSESEREKAKEKFERISMDAEDDLRKFTNRRLKLLSTQLREYAKGQASFAAEQVKILEAGLDSLKALKPI